MKHRCPNCKKIKKEYKEFRQYHNKMMDFFEIRFTTTEEQYKEIISMKVKRLELINKEDKRVLKRFNLRFNKIYLVTKNLLKYNFISRLMIKYFKWLTKHKNFFIRSLKIIGSLGLIQQVINLIRMKGFTFELLHMLFQLVVNIFI